MRKPRGDRIFPVHPRWRGEQGLLAAPGLLVAGSSPLARGTVSKENGGTVEGRFIPAGAGNRCKRWLLSTAKPVHPRWRGEQQILGAAEVEPAGSSPLARGTEPRILRCPPVPRFIPAGAGNSAAPIKSPCSQSVHPRWRGEQRRKDGKPYAVPGSSPLARGTQAGAPATQVL